MIRTGDTIAFRGRRRFVVAARPGSLLLQRVRENRFPSPVVYYSVSGAELAATCVVQRGSAPQVARARKLLEDRSPPWYRIDWTNDQPRYVFDPDKFVPSSIP